MNASRILSAVVVCALASGVATAQTPLGTAFTYQGRLLQNGQPAAGDQSILFELFDVDAGGAPLGSNSLPITVGADGSFTATLDFGVNPFRPRAPCWARRCPASRAAKVSSWFS